MGRYVRRQVEVPGSAVLALAGGAAWLMGSAALPSGTGTVVLALGIAVTVWLMMRSTRSGGTARGARLDRDRRRRVIYLLVVGAGLVVVGSILLRATGRAELTAPLTVAVCGALLLPLASLLDRRALLAVGAGLMLLGAGGAVLALNSAGTTESQGLVGLVGGVLLWVAAAQQAGLADELRERIRR
jgi:uncharacterized membrane protein